MGQIRTSQPQKIRCGLRRPESTTEDPSHRWWLYIAPQARSPTHRRISCRTTSASGLLGGGGETANMKILGGGIFFCQLLTFCALNLTTTSAHVGPILWVHLFMHILFSFETQMYATLAQIDGQRGGVGSHGGHHHTIVLIRLLSKIRSFIVSRLLLLSDY